MASGNKMASPAGLRVFSERGVLVTYLFHGIFAHEGEIAQRVVDPQQRVTVAHFREFVAHLLDRGFEFVAPEHVLAGLPADGHYVMATFDDGYVSNQLVRPVLEEFDVPGVFFISTGHVLAAKSFWWDVVYREMSRRGASAREIQQVGHGLKELTNNQIEDVVVAMFGAKSLVPWGDIDRPFTPSELRSFACCRHVFLGNHTRDHAILTNYSPAGVREQLAGAQDDLERLVGNRPVSVSYPNGNYSADVLQAAREAGLSLGITVERAKNALPLDTADEGPLRLGRYTLWGTRGIAEQCDAVLLDSWWKGVWTKLTGRERSWQRRSA